MAVKLKWYDNDGVEGDKTNDKTVNKDKLKKATAEDFNNIRNTINAVIDDVNNSSVAKFGNDNLTTTQLKPVTNAEFTNLDKIPSIDTKLSTLTEFYSPYVSLTGGKMYVVAVAAEGSHDVTASFSQTNSTAESQGLEYSSIVSQESLALLNSDSIPSAKIVRNGIATAIAGLHPTATSGAIFGDNQTTDKQEKPVSSTEFTNIDKIPTNESNITTNTTNIATNSTAISGLHPTATSGALFEDGTNTNTQKKALNIFEPYFSETSELIYASVLGSMGNHGISIRFNQIDSISQKQGIEYDSTHTNENLNTLNDNSIPSTKSVKLAIANISGGGSTTFGNGDATTEQEKPVSSTEFTNIDKIPSIELNISTNTTAIAGLHPTATSGALFKDGTNTNTQNEAVNLHEEYFSYTTVDGQIQKYSDRIASSGSRHIQIKFNSEDSISQKQGVEYDSTHTNENLNTLNDNSIPSTKSVKLAIANISGGGGSATFGNLESTTTQSKAITNAEFENIDKIPTIESNISTNATGLANQYPQITTNATNIATNKTFSENLVTLIGTNQSNISTNTTAIAGLHPTATSGAIFGDNQTTDKQEKPVSDSEFTNIDKIPTIESNISTNTTNIETNATGLANQYPQIATNTTNISTNTTAISGLHPTATSGALFKDGTNTNTQNEAVNLHEEYFSYTTVGGQVQKYSDRIASSGSRHIQIKFNSTDSISQKQGIEYDSTHTNENLNNLNDNSIPSTKSIKLAIANLSGGSGSSTFGNLESTTTQSKAVNSTEFENIDKIPTNESNIWANTTNITGNTTNIETNTTAIANLSSPSEFTWLDITNNYSTRIFREKEFRIRINNEYLTSYNSHPDFKSGVTLGVEDISYSLFLKNKQFDPFMLVSRNFGVDKTTTYTTTTFTKIEVWTNEPAQNAPTGPESLEALDYSPLPIAVK